jgi:hypothetical protein
VNNTAIEQLIDQWMNDETFRAELRRDPEGTVRARKLDLNEDEWAALRSVDWSLSDEALQARVTKAG